VLHAAGLKYRRQKIAKNSPSTHHRTTLSGNIFATKACIDNRKNTLNSNISSTCSHNMVNFGRLTPEMRWRVWSTPANFNQFRDLVSLLHRRHSTEVNKTLKDVWPSPGLQNSLGVQVLRSPILAALLHGTRAAVSQTSWRGKKRNGITELSQRASPIFSWAAITLGIGPHSSVVSSFIFLAHSEASQIECLVYHTSTYDVALVRV